MTVTACGSFENISDSADEHFKRQMMEKMVRASFLINTGLVPENRCVKIGFFWF